jgi:hypothetical protein
MNPMPAPPRSFDIEQRLSLLQRIPPPLRPGLTPYLLCGYCAKYHTPDRPVRPARYGITRAIDNQQGYWRLKHAPVVICHNPKRDRQGNEEKDNTSSVAVADIKPCDSCWAFGSPRNGGGVQMSCACGKYSYILISLQKICHNHLDTDYRWTREEDE